MANEIKTDLIFQAKGRGFAKVRDEQGRLNEAIREGHKGQKRGFDEAQRASSNFQKSMESAMRAIAGNRRAERALQKIGKEFDNLAAKVSKFEGVLKKADMASGAFFQGLAQGMGAGEFLQRGPGMQRQVAGRMVGRLARAPGAMVGGGMMRGGQGVLGAIQALPGGGAVAGPLGAAMGFAGQALQFQRQRLGAAPMLGGAGLAQRMMAAQGGAVESVKAIQARSEEMRVATAAQEIDPATLKQLRQQRLKEQAATVRKFNVGAKGRMAAADLLSAADISGGRMFPATMFRQEAGAEAAKKEMDTGMEQRRSALARGATVKNRFFEGIKRQGKNLAGMGRQQAEQFAAQLGAAGGTVDPRSMFGAAVAAQTAYGVGADVSGAFLRAERRGGITGGPAGAAGLTQTLADAVRQGFEGSEITDYMRETAEGIRKFEQTGIPINPRSVAGMATAVSTMGLQAPRARRVAQGLFSAGQRIAQTGPTSGLDLLMLQQAGFKGGGMQNLVDAMMQLEETGIGGPGSQELIRTLAKAGGGGAGGLLAVQRGLGRQGVQVGLREAQIMTKQALGQKLSPEESKRLKTLQARREAAGEGPVSPQELKDMARLMTKKLAPNLERQAAIQDKQLEMGAVMLPTVQKLEEASTEMAKVVTTILAPSIAILADVVADGVDKLTVFLDLFKEKGVTEATELKQ